MIENRILEGFFQETNNEFSDEIYIVNLQMRTRINS